MNSKRIFEKENYAENTNHPKNKSLTQLVSLTLLGTKSKLGTNLENANELKNNYVSISQRPLVFCKPKALTVPSPQKQQQQSPKAPDNQSAELCKLITNYSEDILNYYLESNPYLTNSLQNHTVSSNLRAKMVDWMVEVLTSYKCRDQTFFMAVRLMDQYLQKTPKNHVPQDLHLIGVTTMFMACKFEEIYPVKLQIVHEKIAHRKLSKEDIKEKETEISSVLDFNLVGVTVLDILSMVLSILNVNSQLYQTSVYLAKMALYDYTYLCSHNYVQIAGAALIISTKIVEQVDQSLNSEVMIPLIVSTLKLDNTLALESANDLLQLAKGFEKQYPNLENLRKFSKFQMSEVMKM